jgi:hypothetical protein
MKQVLANESGFSDWMAMWLSAQQPLALAIAAPVPHLAI